MNECFYRKVEFTEGCGGAIYWWCYKRNCQINVYENCKDCKDCEEVIT